MLIMILSMFLLKQEFSVVSHMLYFFSLIIFYLFKILKRKFYSDSEISLKEYVLILPLIVYGIDALLNFPVARPLMQSSLAIYLGTVLSIYTGFLNKVIKIKRINIFSIGVLVLSLTILIPGLYIHFISFKSLKQQGRLLYEFNNAQYTYTRDELDKFLILFQI